jgi:hypothetical protein
MPFRALRRVPLTSRMASASLRLLAEAERRRTTALVWGMIIMSIAGAVACGLLAGPVGAAVGMLACPVLVVAAWTTAASAAGARLRARKQATVPMPVRVAAYPAPSPEARRVRVRGRVRAREVLESPLEGAPCVAYRIVGTDGWAEIDDAGACDFVLDTEDGEVHVVAGPATVDLPVARPARVGKTLARLDELLRRRLADPASPRLRLSEAVLAPGDVVEVEATPTDRVATSGYRGARGVRVFREQDGSPLVIRRV